MHGTSTRPRASDAQTQTRGQVVPPRRGVYNPTAHAPKDGCVIYTHPFGLGVAYRVVDHVQKRVIDEDTASTRDNAITKGKRVVTLLYGPGEPVTVLSLEVL